jgi:exosortase
MQVAATANPKLRAVPWGLLAGAVVLLIAAYWPVLTRLAGDWAHDDDMGHGFFVPLVSLYFLWTQRAELERIELKPSAWGYLLLLWGGLQLIAATLGAELTLARGAFVISLVGVVLTTLGWKMLKAMAFPLFLLLFMIPLPAIIYNQITFPLQLLASSVAETVLSAAGIPVLRDGNILELPSQRLSVVEACSGIRSLLSLTFLSLVYGTMFDSRPWMKWALLAGIVPIAIAANAGRVTITGFISEYDPALTQGVYHSMEGWVLFSVAVALLIALHRVLCLLPWGRKDVQR